MIYILLTTFALKFNLRRYTKGGASDGQSPLKIALFSLGNLCTHRECRDRLLALGFEAKVRRFRLNG